MQKIQVTFGAGTRKYTYDAPVSVKVGDRVEVEHAKSGGTMKGDVVELGSSYTGPCKSIMGVVG